MILKGTVRVTSIDGRKNKCILLLEEPLYEPEDIGVEEEAITFKTALNLCRSQIIYFEYHTDVKIDGKIFWVVFDKYESEWINLYDSIVETDSAVLAILNNSIKNDFKIDFNMKISENCIENKDMHFHKINPRFIMPDKSAGFMEKCTLKASIALNKNKPLFYADYILYDMKYISLDTINLLFKTITKDEYIKFIFNFLTCMPSAELGLRFASVGEFNKHILNKFVSNLKSIEESKGFISYGKELETIFRDDNFNLDIENCLELIILNPFMLSLIFENNYSLIPIFIMECILVFIYDEVLKTAQGVNYKDIEKEIKALITRAYILYVFKLLELGQSIPETSSTGKILQSKYTYDLSSGNTLVDQADYLFNLHNFIAVRKYYFEARGDFIKLQSSYSTITNPLLSLYPYMNQSYEETFNFKSHVKSVWDSFIIYGKGNFIFLKSTHVMNTFIQEFLREHNDSESKIDYNYLYEKLDSYTKDQRSAIINFINHKMMIISGRAGTGKTYLITDIICNILKQDHIKFESKKDRMSKEELHRAEREVDSLFIILSYTNKAVSKLNENLIDKFHAKGLDIPYSPSPIINDCIKSYKDAGGKTMNRVQFNAFITDYIDSNMEKINKAFGGGRDVVKLLLKKEIKNHSYENINNTKHIWLSTIDSFVYKMIYDIDRIRLHNKVSHAKKIYLIFDETGMIALNKIVLLLTTMSNKVQQLNHRQYHNLIDKIIFLGDYAQLNSIENGDLFGDLITVLPLVDLKESVRYGEDKKIADFFEIIRNLQYNTDTRDKAYKYLSGQKQVSSTENNIELISVEDKLLDKGDSYYYSEMSDTHDYLYSFFYRMVADLAKTLLNVDLSKEYFMRETPKNFKDHTAFIQKNAHQSFYQYAKSKRSGTGSVPEIIKNIFINNAHLFKIITLYKKEKNILDSYHISSSKRINKLIAYTLYGLRTLHGDTVFEKVDGINTPRSIPKKQMIKYNDKSIEIDKLVQKLVDAKSFEELQIFMQEKKLNKIFLTENVPYIVTSRRLRKFGLNIGDFIKFIGLKKENKSEEAVFHHMNKLNVNKFDGYHEEVYVPINYLTINDLDYGYAVNVHQLQGDEFPYIIVPFLGNIYPYQMDMDKVSNKNLRQFDMKAFYTAISRLKIKEGTGKLIIYFGQQFLDIINEIQPIIRNTPFKEIILKQI